MIPLRKHFRLYSKSKSQQLQKKMDFRTIIWCQNPLSKKAKILVKRAFGWPPRILNCVMMFMESPKSTLNHQILHSVMKNFISIFALFSDFLDSIFARWRISFLNCPCIVCQDFFFTFSCLFDTKYRLTFQSC